MHRMHCSVCILSVLLLSELLVVIVGLRSRGNLPRTLARSRSTFTSVRDLKLRADFFEHCAKPIKSAISALLTGVCLLNGTPVFAENQQSVFDEVWTIANENFYDGTFNKQDWTALKQLYKEKIANGGNAEALASQLLSSLGDKYTKLLSSRDFEKLWKYDAIGVGLLLQSDPHSGMRIAAPPTPGSSAESMGLKEGDGVVNIEGTSTAGLTAMQLLELFSNNRNPTITLQVVPTDGGEPRTVTLQRSFAKAVNPVSYSTQRLPDGTLAGYIRLSEFNAEAVPAMEGALRDLTAQGIDELVLDLRGNTGGGFQFALNIGGMFMHDKPMVTAQGRDAAFTQAYRTSYPAGVLYDKPLVVVTDGLSASASEVLAVGLRDNCRAAIVGDKTFGKGKIQGVFGLSNGEGVVMTVAEYRGPRGEAIQSVGIAPDVPLPSLNPYLRQILTVLWPFQPDVRAFNIPTAINALERSCPPP